MVAQHGDVIGINCPLLIEIKLEGFGFGELTSYDSSRSVRRSTDLRGDNHGRSSKSGSE